jgi:hypothetical protein
MTKEKEKAIEILKGNLCTVCAYGSQNMMSCDIKYCDNREAIKALEQEPILDKIKAEIKEWYWQADKQALAKDPCVVDAMVDLFIRTINKYKAEREEKK